MVETELVQGRRQANPATNSAGLTQRPVHNTVYKFKSESGQHDDYPIHQLQQDEGVNWIVIGENDRIHDQTNSYFEIIRQPNGDIHLRLVDIFSTKNRSLPQLSQEADDQDYGGSE